MNKGSALGKVQWCLCGPWKGEAIRTWDLGDVPCTAASLASGSQYWERPEGDMI